MKGGLGNMMKQVQAMQVPLVQTPSTQSAAIPQSEPTMQSENGPHTAPQSTAGSSPVILSSEQLAHS